jgi:ParB-like chromosome segregation protein Spo0J
MDTMEILCELIDVPAVDKKERTFSKEFAGQLAESIRVEGLLNPITVRPNPDKPGSYLIVAGEHRFYAVKKVLKRETIRCTVFVEMDADDAEMARTTENLWRSELKKEQRMLAIQKWHEFHMKKYAPKPSAADTSESAAESDPKPIDGATDEVANLAEDAADPKQITAAEKKAEGEFVKQLANATGQSERSARRKTRIARVFTPDELLGFLHVGVTEQQMEAIAGVKDDEKRHAVTALVLSGLDFQEAWKATFGVEVDFSASSKAEKQEKAEARAEKVPELTDAEWFERECGEKAKLLGDPTLYKQSALLYRHTAEPRAKFRSAIKKEIAAMKAAGQTKTPLYGLLNRVISMSHPKDWFFCDDCQGKGHKDGQPCSKCRTGCVALRTENYL